MKYLFACHIPPCLGILFIYLFVCLHKSGLKSSHSGSSSPVMAFWVSTTGLFFFFFLLPFHWVEKNMTVLCVSECQYLCACESFSVNHNKHSLFMYNVLWVCLRVAALCGHHAKVLHCLCDLSKCSRSYSLASRKRVSWGKSLASSNVHAGSNWVIWWEGEKTHKLLQ